MFSKAAIQHLRLRFSLLLLPVFLLSVYGVVSFSDNSSTLVLDGLFYAFFIWHLCIYPASNAFNSYQDQDAASIGDLKNPLIADRSVLYISIILNAIGLIAAYLINPFFMAFILVYIISSQVYSWRKIRLKRFPIVGFLVIFAFQGFWVLVANRFACNISSIDMKSYCLLGLAASFMFGGGYPITQIYQHTQDKEDGVKTISMLLGIRGTLIFSVIMNVIGLAILGFVVIQNQGWLYMALYLLILAPSLYYFSKWAAQVFKVESKANFENVMRMTWISAICNNIAILVLLLKPLISF